MQTIAASQTGARLDGVQSRLVYCALLPLFLASVGMHRISVSWTAHDEEKPGLRAAWFADASSQASIATSYALMARSMLHSSERRRRPARLS